MSERKPIVIQPSAHEFLEADIDASRSDFEVRRPEDPLDILESHEKPVAFVCTSSSWDDTYLKELPADSWVTTIGSGYDRFPVDAFTARGVTFMHIPGISAKQIAEHAFGMAFAFSRQLLSYRDKQRAHEWGRWPGMIDYADEVCCVIGLGGIGEAVAKRAQAFEMTVRGVKQNIDAYDGDADAVYLPDELQDALQGAQLVVIAVPLTDQTRGMISADEFAAISDDAVGINVSRGPVIETRALLDALSTGELRALGLDVTNPEPLPPDSPLWIGEMS